MIQKCFWLEKNRNVCECFLKSEIILPRKRETLNIKKLIKCMSARITKTYLIVLEGHGEHYF